MALHTSTLKSAQKHWYKIAAAACLAAFLVAALSTAKPADAWGWHWGWSWDWFNEGKADLVVDDDGQASLKNCDSTDATPHTTVSSAVAAAVAGNVIKVCPGTYVENVVIDKELTLKGAKFGTEVYKRTFADANEATVTGQVTIQAAKVKVEGFSLTNPGQGLGVVVKTAGDEAEVKKNIIGTVGSNTFVGPVVGVYLEHGPDGVSVVENLITDIQSQTGSAQGVLIGDSTASNPSLDTKVKDNQINNITSATRGAYGVQVNNGASTAPTATGYTELVVSGNNIANLSGNWVHAIGLEGETPNAVVKRNIVSNLNDTNPVPIADAAGVFFEANPFFLTANVNRNSLDVGTTNFGVALHPNLAAQYPSLSVDAECNWWGSKKGPGAVASGNGSLVSANVDYKPWLKNSNLNKDCGGDKDNDRHFGDWNDWDDKWYHKWD